MCHYGRVPGLAAAGQTASKFKIASVRTGFTSLVWSALRASMAASTTSTGLQHLNAIW